jgi:hypothetical protein
MKVNYKRISENIIFFMLGTNIANLIWHFRFQREILLKEMLLFMNEGNGYFLDWFYLEIPFLLIIILIYFIGFKLKWKKSSKTVEVNKK